MQINPPPAPITKVPKVRCPKGSIDAHFHLFGPADQYPVDSATAYLTADALPEDLLAMHKAIGVSGGVYVGGGLYGRNPRHLLDMLARYPGIMRGIAVPPEHLDATEIERMHGLGVRGVRFASHARARHLAGILPDVAAAIADFGWHVQFYTLNGEIVEHADALLALPNTIVLDHFGSIQAELGLDQPAFKTILNMLDTGRVWVKLSAPLLSSNTDLPYSDLIPFAHKLVEHAPERLVWGTDWPHPNLRGKSMPNDGDLVDLMLDWVPDDEIRRRIFVTNPRALYDFPPMGDQNSSQARSRP